jgi:uncharacterized protein YaiL (DUF2058 family)
MSMSLREQLLKAGLVTEKQARQAESQQRQQARKGPGRKAPTIESTPDARQAQAAKAARDQELNRHQQEKAAAKERIAQLRQLIEQHRVPLVESEDYYNFVVDRQVRRIAVDATLRARLVRGDLAIVRCDGQYYLVPASCLPRIRERDPQAVIHANAPTATSTGPHASESTPGDPYKDYVVPDDLTW